MNADDTVSDALRTSYGHRGKERAHFFAAGDKCPYSGRDYIFMRPGTARLRSKDETASFSFIITSGKKIQTENGEYDMWT